MNRILLLASSLLLVDVAVADLLKISDARIPLPPPGAPVAAAYLTLVNTDDQALVIRGASSPVAAKVELHLSMVVDDVAKMVLQDELVIEPGAALVLEHGSYHLMFMGMHEALAVGDEVAVTMDTSAGPLDIVLPVSARNAKSAGHSGHGKKGDAMGSDGHEGMKHKDENQEMPSMDMPNSNTDSE